MNKKSDPSIKLAGYVDGELSLEERASVEAGLAQKSDSRSELDAQRQFARDNAAFWQRLAPPEPSDAVWAETLARIQHGLEQATPIRYAVKGRPWKWIAATSAIAAAIAFIVFTGVLSNREAESVAQNDAWPIAGESDVDIVSVQGDDPLDSMIIVGRLPLEGVMDVVTAGETKLDAIVYEGDAAPTKLVMTDKDPHKKIWIIPTDKMHPVP